MSKDMKEKISLFCDVDKEGVIECRDVDSIYEIPMKFEDDGLSDLVLKRFGLENGKPDLAEWRKIVGIIKKPKHKAVVAIVGKYTGNGDAYLSLGEAVKHGGIANDTGITLDWIDSEGITDENVVEKVGHADAIIIPGGFGARGVEGKVATIRYAREKSVPFLGICYGLHWAVVEAARHKCSLAGANTAEVDEDTQHPVIHILPEQEGVSDKGATMRLGVYPCRIIDGSLASRLYSTDLVYERHRHRYEVNNSYRAKLERGGLICTGVSPDYRLVEIVERKDHPFFIATQFHPEFKSRPNRAHPIFAGLVEAALAYQVGKPESKPAKTAVAK